MEKRLTLLAKSITLYFTPSKRRELENGEGEEGGGAYIHRYKTMNVMCDRDVALVGGDLCTLRQNKHLCPKKQTNKKTPPQLG